ncbi:hypothetical protein [Chondrinema litorale]|uniref:hypothetical protein n=1 Tax=Chondrinema litorale TaxID=2994555 RepID=UPI0025433CF6|nr:hypothetical protein [Chondrinema litorale]UZR98546.1 hypothetical protein OQ292_31580 [Chondrinema litorale]
MKKLINLIVISLLTITFAFANAPINGERETGGKLTAHGDRDHGKYIHSTKGGGGIISGVGGTGGHGFAEGTNVGNGVFSNRGGNGFS